MNKEEYKNYLQSQHWEELKKLKASKKTKRCGICAAEKNIDLHHLNYKNIYDVETTDLRWLCRRCHYLAHELMKSGKIKFKNDNHHSKFIILKTAIKKCLGLKNKNMFNENRKQILDENKSKGNP